MWRQSRITTNECQDRVDSCETSVCENLNTLLHPRSRPVCVQAKSSSSLVCGTSPRPDPGAMVIDAFTLDWSQWTSFIHPPIVLLNRVLLKTRQDRATALLMAPAWVGQPWYPSLLDILVDFPAKLPISQKTLFLPFDQTAVHPLWKTLALTVWPLSGDECKQQEFQRRCAISSLYLGEQVLQKGMQAHGKLGLTGVMKGTGVPFQQL